MTTTTRPAYRQLADAAQALWALADELDSTSIDPVSRQLLQVG